MRSGKILNQIMKEKLCQIIERLHSRKLRYFIQSQRNNVRLKMHKNQARQRIMINYDTAANASQLMLVRIGI